MFPLLGLLPKLIKTAAGILGVDSVKDVVDTLQNNKLTPEQRVALETALQQHEKEMRALDIEELKTVMSESLAEIQSTDKFTSRARPFGVYTACAITAALAVAMMFGVKLDTGAIITLIAPLWGQTAWYTYKRTQEKMNGSHGD